MFFLDPTYLCFMAPGFLLVLFASWYVKAAYNKWGRVRVRSGLTGAQAAQRLITSGNLTGVQIQTIGGNLTDNYDPRDKVLHLSQNVAGTASVAGAAAILFGVPLLGDDLGLQLRGSSFLGRRKRAGRSRCRTGLGSGRTGMSLARTVRSASALGHVG